MSNGEHRRNNETLKAHNDGLEKRNKLLWWSTFLLALKGREAPEVKAAEHGDQGTAKGADGRSQGLVSEMSSALWGLLYSLKI